MLDSNKFLSQIMNVLNQSTAGAAQANNKTFASMIRETADEVVVAFEVPGIQSREDIHFSIDVTRVGIKGVRHKVEESGSSTQGNGMAQERFEKNLALPHPVRPETASASYSKGILTLRLKKLEGKTFSNVLLNFHS